MSTRSVTISTMENKDQTCQCGCARCDGTCCSLDCLERPRFFCGQLLTDQDLTALVGWTQDKLRLTRYRHGWGVVCGLEVRCDPDPKRAGWVTVSSGYAVSCCGDDIIVCEDTPYDLRDACGTIKEPCADLESPDDSADEPDRIELAGYSLPVNEVHTLDLYIRYHEEMANPQTALGRSVCKEVAECEYSRFHEAFELTSVAVERSSNPVKAAAKRWHDAYEKCMEIVARFRARFSLLDNGPKVPADLGDSAKRELGKSVQNWLLDRITEKPLHQFCWVRDRICEMSTDQLVDPAQLSAVLFWIVQDYRNAFLHCDCHACAESPGLPLARVWLRVRMDDQGEQDCQVLHIDAYPPYRRPINPECWPAPLGYVNGGQLIWHPWAEACTSMADLGLHVGGTEEFIIPDNFADLDKKLSCDLFLACKETTVVQIYQAEGLGERVVGFCGAKALPADIDLSVDKGSLETEARPGDTVTYHFKVENTGGAALIVDLTDDELGTIAEGLNLEPGAGRRIEHKYRVGEEAAGFLHNIVVASGQAADGRTTSAIAAHTLKIVAPPGLDISVAKDSRETVARPGGTVAYLFRVRNTGEAGLRIDVDDNVLGPIAGGFYLDPGATREFEKEYAVPREARQMLYNTVEVVGRSEDGRTVTASATHALRVIQAPGIDLSVAKGSREQAAQPGGIVNYVIEVRNNGGAALNIEVIDDVLGLAHKDRLEPGDNRAYVQEYRVPENASGELVNQVVVTGTSDDGRSLEVADEHRLRIIPSRTNRAVARDNFEEIGGIAAGRAKTLYDAEINTFSELAEAPFEKLRGMFSGLVSDEMIREWQEVARERARNR